MNKSVLHTEKWLIIALIFTSAQGILQAQSLKQFSSQNFNVSNGLLANHIVDIAEDDVGFVWVSFGAGLQRFNGNDFETVFPQQGLPETNHPYFFKLQDGRLWLSYYSGISAYNSITGKFKILYKSPESDLKKAHQPEQYQNPPVIPVLETANEVWCWSAPEHQFIAIDKLTLEVTDTLNITGQFQAIQNFKRSDAGTLFFSFGQGIAEINFAAKKIVHLYHFPPMGNFVYDYYPLKNDKLLLATNNGIFRIDFANGTSKRLCSYPREVNTRDIARISLSYLYNNLFVISVNNQLYMIDATAGRFLYRMVNRQNQNFIDPGYITSCMFDHFHNLWLLSFSGLIKISFSTLDIRYFGVTDVRKNFSRCILPDKKAGLVIIGSLFNQLSVFDTSGHLLKQFSIPPTNAEKQVSSILKVANNRYLIFAMGKYSVYLLNTATMRISPLYAGDDIRYHPLKVTGDTAAILAQPNGVVEAVYSTEKIRLKPLVNTNVSCALVDDRGWLWIGSTGKYSILKGKDFSDKSVFYLKENVLTKCLLQDNERNIWMGTEKGLYKINPDNGAILRVYKKENGLADETIYSVLEDDNQNIWCSTNKGISCIYKNGAIMNLYAVDGLQGNEFNTNVGAKASDGELFFGGTNGVNGFYPGQINIPDKKPVVLLQRIRVMDASWRSDTTAWNSHILRLPYTKNVITFDFIALGHYNPDIYNYSYKMQGLDTKWVNAGNSGHARYALPPGKYIFEYAADAGNKHTKSTKYITIMITPPFWQTTGFKVMILIALSAILWAIMYLYNKRKYQKKLQQVKIQQSIQRERHRISRDLHDHIGAYTTALAAGAEHLNTLAAANNMQQIAEGISSNAKSIVASLQETIWVLNNDTITMTDFSDRFKVFARKILPHYPGIQIKFHEEIIKDAKLSPIEALNVFRVMQEALHNALRHSYALLVEVFIISNQEMIRFTLKDNGHGFDIHQQRTGNGLYNIRHRCEEVGYLVNIVSDASGTTISLEKNHSFAV